MNEEIITKILRKKKPNGKDLGRLFFFINMTLISSKAQDTNSKMIDSMKQYLEHHLKDLDAEETETYIDFANLHNIVHTYNYLGQGYYQQALRCFYRMMLIVGNSPIFVGIQSMDDEFDIENVKEDVRSFVVALKRAFAIDQFFKDVEKKFELDGLLSVYGVSDTLAECVQSYNDVVKRLEEEKSPIYNDLLSCLPPIFVEDCLPKEKNIRIARKKLRNISVFRDKMVSTEFYDAYIPEQ